jgi:hypothetical protein
MKLIGAAVLLYYGVFDAIAVDANVVGRFGWRQPDDRTFNVRGRGPARTGARHRMEGMTPVRKRILLSVIVPIVVIVLLVYSAERAIKNAIEGGGTNLTGSDVSVADIKISVLAGSFEMSGFHVPNPVAFGPGTAFKTDRFVVNWGLMSLPSDQKVIEEIVIDGPDITYAMTMEHSNLGLITDTVSTAAARTEKGDVEDEDGETANITVANFYLRNATVGIAFPGLSDAVYSVPLPDIHFTDLSGDTVNEIVATVVELVFAAVLDEVGSLDNELLRRQLKLLGVVGEEASEANGGIIEDAAKSLTNSLKDIFGNSDSDD